MELPLHSRLAEAALRRWRERQEGGGQAGASSLPDDAVRAVLDQGGAVPVTAWEVHQSAAEREAGAEGGAAGGAWESVLSEALSGTVPALGLSHGEKLRKRAAARTDPAAALEARLRGEGLLPEPPAGLGAAAGGSVPAAPRSAALPPAGLVEQLGRLCSAHALPLPKKPRPGAGQQEQLAWHLAPLRIPGPQEAGIQEGAAAGVPGGTTGSATVLVQLRRPADGAAGSSTDAGAAKLQLPLLPKKTATIQILMEKWG